MGAIDSNGIYIYDELDNEATHSDLLNLGQDATSDTVAAIVATATANNNALDARLDALEAGWTSYTPTLTNVTLGTGGTVTGTYSQIRKDVDFEVVITLGTSGTLSGPIQVTTPSNIATTEQSPIAMAFLSDASASGAAAIEWRFGHRTTTNAVQFRAADGTPDSSTVPWTWATGDKAIIRGRYRAA